MINLSKEINNNEAIVTVGGRLDTSTALEFEGFIDECLSQASALVIECKDLEYVSSAGLRVLLAAHKKTAGAMKLTNVCEIVMEVFEMTGFADILTIA